MNRLVLPALDPVHRAVYDEGRGFLAVGQGETVSIYSVAKDGSSINLICAFPTNDGACSEIKINRNPLTTKVYILIETITRIAVYSLCQVDCVSQIEINPLTVHEHFTLMQTGSTVVWDPRRVDSLLLCTTNGVLCRIVLGLETSEKWRMEILHEFNELVSKIMFSPRNPSFYFCMTDSDLFALHEDNLSVKIKVFGLEGIVDFDISPFGYLVAITPTQLSMFDIGMFNCKSFDSGLFGTKSMKSVRMTFRNAKQVFCDRNAANVMYAFQSSPKGDFLLKFSMDPKCDPKYCRLEPGTVFLSYSEGKFVCATEKMAAYIVRVAPTMMISMREPLQFMSKRCMCDVHKGMIVYEDFEGEVSVSESNNGEIELAYRRQLGDISSMKWFSDDCIVVLTHGKLRKLLRDESGFWSVSTLLRDQLPPVLTSIPVEDFWILPGVAVCAKIGQSILATFDIDEKKLTFDTHSGAKNVSMCLNNDVLEKFVLPTPEVRVNSGVLTQTGAYYYMNYQILNGTKNARVPFEGALMKFDDNQIVIANQEEFLVFDAATLEPKENSRQVPGKPIKFSDDYVFCVDGTKGLFVSALKLVTSDFVKSDIFESIETPILVLSTEDMTKTINYSLRLYAIFDPESPEVDEIGCLSKTSVVQPEVKTSRDLSVDELQRKIFAQLGPIESDVSPDTVARKVAEGGQFRRAAILQHTFRKFDDAVDYLLQGGIYELANLYVKLYGIEGKEARIMACAVNEMIDVGNYVEAYQVLKAKGCYRGCLFVRKLLGWYDRMDDEMIAEAQEEGNAAKEIEDSISGMETVEQIVAWRDKCLNGDSD